MSTFDEDPDPQLSKRELDLIKVGELRERKREVKTKPLHFAGIITGVTMKDGMEQVTATCSLGQGKPQLQIALPIEPSARGEWAMRMGERVVLSLQLVEDSLGVEAEAEKAARGLDLPSLLPHSMCQKKRTKKCLDPKTCHGARECLRSEL